MNRNLLFILFIILVLLDLSCQEDFNPKTDFKEQYVLNCYIDLDYDFYHEATIYASVTKLYDVNGLNPSQRKIDPFISGARILCDCQGNRYYLNEDTNGTIAKRPPPELKYKFYYWTKMFNIYPNYSAFITAIMPDGEVLSSNIKLLEGLQFGFSYDFIRGFTTKINRFLFGNTFNISWGPIENRLFFPKMIIQYLKKGDYTHYEKEVPLTYINRNGLSEPVYPFPTSSDNISYDYSSFDSTMAQIVHTNNFDGFFGIDFEMVEFDGPLSKYYESTHGSLDDYSISLDQFVYSNVSGGLGIFGSTRIIRKGWGINPEYQISFLQKK
ncbi:MAG: hypothetical protein M1480_11040 [Bacteroidetes bacterium]|nr:hypothetical protein [Bacteroidota bacterium]